MWYWKVHPKIHLKKEYYNATTFAWIMMEEQREERRCSTYSYQHVIHCACFLSFIAFFQVSHGPGLLPMEDSYRLSSKLQFDISQLQPLDYSIVWLPDMLETFAIASFKGLCRAFMLYFFFQNFSLMLSLLFFVFYHHGQIWICRTSQFLRLQLKEILGCVGV